MFPHKMKCNSSKPVHPWDEQNEKIWPLCCPREGILIKPSVKSNAVHLPSSPSLLGFNAEFPWTASKTVHPQDTQTPFSLEAWGSVNFGSPTPLICDVDNIAIIADLSLWFHCISWSGTQLSSAWLGSTATSKPTNCQQWRLILDKPPCSWS